MENRNSYSSGESVLGIWNVLARRRLGSYLIETSARPHVSLSLHTPSDLEPSKLRTAIENFAQQQHPIPVALAAVGSFPAASVPRPAFSPTAANSTSHASTGNNSVMSTDGGNSSSTSSPGARASSGAAGTGVGGGGAAAAAGATGAPERLAIPCDPNYLPGSWLPICPVAQELPEEKLPSSFHTVRSQKLPLSGHLCEIGLVEFVPSGAGVDSRQLSASKADGSMVGTVIGSGDGEKGWGREKEGGVVQGCVIDGGMGHGGMGRWDDGGMAAWGMEGWADGMMGGWRHGAWRDGQMG
ncbi:unnamed protein product [Closterium sp. Naga37s-1]|nr:unnamed protein product [Closterium sp. Naga37s-1]